MMRKIKISFLVTIMMLLLALLAEAFITACFPQYTFNGHWAVPIFFWVFYVCASLFIKPGMKSMEFTRCFIGLKAAKIFFSMIFVAVASALMRENVLAIVFNFFVYYLLLLIPECAYGVYMKKHIK